MAAGNPLELDPEEFRTLGHWVVDRAAEHLATLRDRPPISVAPSAELQNVLGGPVPRSARPVSEGLALLADVGLENQQHGDHPRYFARVPGPSCAVAILGDWLATGMQGVASSWVGGSGTATLELVALEWLRSALGLPAGAEGVLVSGGSMAGITALVAARSATGPGVVYLSDQTHASIRRGLVAIDWPAADIRILPADADFRLTAASVRTAVGADLAAGRRPAVVVATLGTTNTGAVDDIPGIATICAEHDLWLHVDGAYGGPALLASARVALDGVDSFVLDPHKWLFQPYDIGCLWVNRIGSLERAFAMYPEYLVDTRGGPVDLHNRGLELTRRSRAAKLWLTLRTYGLDALASAVQRGMDLAVVAQRAVESEPGLDVVTPAQLGIVTFSVRGLDDAGHVRLAAAVTAAGYAALSSTVLAGRTVLRLCTIHPGTTDDEIRQTVHRMARQEPIG